MPFHVNKFHSDRFTMKHNKTTEKRGKIWTIFFFVLHINLRIIFVKWTLKNPFMFAQGGHINLILTYVCYPFLGISRLQYFFMLSSFCPFAKCSSPNLSSRCFLTCHYCIFPWRSKIVLALFYYHLTCLEYAISTTTLSQHNPATHL